MSEHSITTLPDQATLHQLVISHKAWADFLVRIQNVWQADDLLLLIGEAAQGYHDPRLQSFSHIAVLESDAQLLNIDSPPFTIAIFSNDDWADAVLNYQRCITWR
jgi:hypothetical protein